MSLVKQIWAALFLMVLVYASYKEFIKYAEEDEDED